VLAALMIADQFQDSDRLSPEIFGLGAGLAAFLGHMFSPYLRFRGGKGVATGAGVVVMLLPIPALGALITWVAVVCASRIVSLASLAAAVTLCVIQLALMPPLGAGPRGANATPLEELLPSAFCFLAAVLVVVRHRANIRRLVQGTENRLPESTAMNQLSKTIHVLTLGLWFGSAGFLLLIVTVSLFQTFESLGQERSRPEWFPVKGTIYDYSDDLVDGRKEQGSRAAATAVAPLFLWFFMLQGACGLLAVATSLSWSRLYPQERAHKARTWLLLAALATVLIGWPIEQRVSALRPPRDQAIDAYLRAQEKEDAAGIAIAARNTFLWWHLASLALSFVTLILVTGTMALAARLPADQRFVSESTPTAPVTPAVGAKAPSG
jgi:acyl-phosphate glycerol 3-phosphate acyltransferase